MSIDNEVIAMQKAPIFENVDAARLRLLAMSGDHVHFAAGEPIFRKGDPADHVVFILGGRVATAFAFELQHLVGHVAVLLRKPHAVDIVADTAVEALRVPAREFLDLIGHCNQLSLAVLRELSRIIYGISTARAAETAQRPAVVQGGYVELDHD